MNAPTPPGSDAASARRWVIAQLKQDRRSLARAFRDFEKLDPAANAARMHALAARALGLLAAHAAVEAAALYPALRRDGVHAEAVAESEVRHQAMAELAACLHGADVRDPGHAARFRILGEYVRHHVLAEESDLLGGTEPGRVDWEEVAAALRRAREAPAAGDAGPT